MNVHGLIQESTINSSNILTSELQEVNVSDDFFARDDAFSICGLTLCLMLLLIWVFNSITELFNKGGLFSI